MTGRNKLLGGILFIMVATQFLFSICYIVKTGMSPRKFQNLRLSAFPGQYFPVQALPEIKLDPYMFCFYVGWLPGELTFTIQATIFGM